MESEMGGPGLLVLGLASLAILIIGTLLRAALQQHARAGLVSGVLAFVTAATLVAAVCIHTFVSPTIPNPLAPTFGAGVLAIAMGMAAFLLEKRRQTFAADVSLGLLVTTVGVLLVVVVLFVPILPTQLWPVYPTATIAASGRVLTPAVPTIATVAPTQMPSLLPTRTLTAAPSPQFTATPTRGRYSTRTPTPTALITSVCSAVVNFNLNLRAEPNLDSEVLAVIPYSTIVSVSNRSQDAAWWFVEYNGQWGWVSADFVSAETRCSAVLARQD